MSRSPKNLAASVSARLLNRAHATGDDYQILLTSYCFERFLYRLGASEVRNRFVLKGAMLLWYVIAFCERSEGIRFFRLDRVVSLDRLDAAFEVPSDFSAARLMREGRAFSGETERSVRVRYSPVIARWVAEQSGAQVGADGGLELEHPMSDIAWAVRHVLQYGAEAEVISPPDVRAAVVRALEMMAAGLT